MTFSWEKERPGADWLMLNLYAPEFVNKADWEALCPNKKEALCVAPFCPRNKQMCVPKKDSGALPDKVHKCVFYAAGHTAAANRQHSTPALLDAAEQCLSAVTVNGTAAVAQAGKNIIKGMREWAFGNTAMCAAATKQGKARCYATKELVHNCIWVKNEDPLLGWLRNNNLDDLHPRLAKFGYKTVADLTDRDSLRNMGIAHSRQAPLLRAIAAENRRWNGCRPRWLSLEQYSLVRDDEWGLMMKKTLHQEVYDRNAFELVHGTSLGL